MNAILRPDALAPSAANESGAASSLAAPRPSLAVWLRLLWNVAPPLLAVPEGEPFITEGGLHLPPAPAGSSGDSIAGWQGAACAHAAAHIVFSRRVFSRQGVAPITQALLGLLEDARVEALACRELPGLRRLWMPFHLAGPADGDDFLTLMLRLSRALADPLYDDPHAWVRKGRARFFLDADGEVLAHAAPEAMRSLASALGNDIGQMRMAFDLRSYKPGPSYRDDNRWLWMDSAGASSATPLPSVSSAAPQSGAANQSPPQPLCWRYAEWDRLIGRLRPDWCTVRRREPEPGSGSGSGLALRGIEVEANDRMLTHSLALLLRKAALRARVQRRREQEGDDIDLDEWLLAIDSPLRGSSPGHASGDPERVYRRMSRKPVRCAMLLLVDCSASSARPYGPDAALSQLAAQQRAASLLAQAACAAGWSVAIQGFSSDGRHRVEHWHVKDFAEPWDSSAAQSLANLGCGGSTRLGAAIRHASTALSREAADCRWLLALGDGEPHDVDIHDPRYLVEDARHAVQMARMQGIDCSALLFDAAMANIPEQVFGKNAALPLRALEGLPSALGRLVARRR